MVPIGILFGNLLQQQDLNNDFLQPIFSFIASGTFIFLGTLHGFKKMITHKNKNDFSEYAIVVMEFLLMSIITIWL